MVMELQGAVIPSTDDPGVSPVLVTSVNENTQGLPASGVHFDPEEAWRTSELAIPGETEFHGGVFFGSHTVQFDRCFRGFMAPRHHRGSRNPRDVRQQEKFPAGR